MIAPRRRAVQQSPGGPSPPRTPSANNFGRRDSSVRRLETSLDKSATFFGPGVAGDASTLPGPGIPDHIGDSTQWMSASSRPQPAKLVVGAQGGAAGRWKACRA